MIRPIQFCMYIVDKSRYVFTCAKRWTRINLALIYGDDLCSFCSTANISPAAAVKPRVRNLFVCHLRFSHDQIYCCGISVMCLWGTLIIGSKTYWKYCDHLYRSIYYFYKIRKINDTECNVLYKPLKICQWISFFLEIFSWSFVL